MPLDHGCRLDQHHGIEDLRPNPEKPKPEKSVRGEEPNPTWVLPTQDAHLMPQANQLELQGGARRNRKARMEMTVDKIAIMPATVRQCGQKL
jgi:hypothetical protein